MESQRYPGKTKNLINKIILLSYMEMSKISSRGQLVIPQTIRQELDLNEGSIVGMENLNGMIVIKKMNTDLIGQFEKSLLDLKSKKVRKLA